MSNTGVPIWETYTLTIEEATKCFCIGENKQRKVAEENAAASWLVMSGSYVQIKRRQFEKRIDGAGAI